MQFALQFAISEQGLSSAIARHPDPVLIADDGRRYLYGNAAACALLGMTLDELVGRRIEEFAPPALREEVEQSWNRFIEQGFQKGEFQLVRADGCALDVEFTAVASIMPGVHVSFLRDVTQQKQAERARFESERTAQLAMSAGRMGNWVWHAPSGTVTWNEMLERIYGIEPGNPPATYEGFLALIHSDDRAFVRQKIGETGRFGYEYEVEYRVVRADGEVRWLADRGRTVFDSTGTRIGLTGVCWDITERKAAEAALRLSEARFRNLLEQSPLSTQVFAPDGHSILVNRAWTEFWGAKPEDVQDYNILHDSQLEARGVMAQIQRAFEGEACELPVITYSPPAGSYAGTEIWVRAFIYPVQDDEGRVREIVVIHEDVTNAKNVEKERQAQAQELARSNAELQRFVYVASHDLKEPLRNMTTFSQLLAVRGKERLQTDELEYLEYITGAATRMASLIDGLLEYSRASFQRDLPFVNAELNELLQQATDNLRATITQSKAVITWDPLPRIRCAPLNIVQLFQNLIGNAIKYCKREQPLIHISASEGQESGCLA